MRLLLAVGVCVVLGVAGCGGDGGSNTASAPASTTEGTQAATPQRSQHRALQGDEGKGKEADRSAAKGGGKDGASPKSASLVKAPPISSAPIAGSKAPAPGVKTVKGGDNSVQTYGTEADESVRIEAAIALQAYLNARSQEDWGSACSYLAQRPTAQLEKLTSQLQSQGKDTAGCAAAMAALGKGASQKREEPTITEVLSFRGEGDVPGNPSYLIFTGPPASTLYSMPMYLEEGGWKVGLALPSELPV
ncbi:MAG: hypothetical protein ACRDLL_00570 [Solirubrobacterales bacterium]